MKKLNLNDYFNLQYYKSVFLSFLKNDNKTSIFNMPLRDHNIDDTVIRSFLKSKDLSENDKKIVELYNDKKISKIMLVKYIGRKDKTWFRGKIHLMLVFLSPIWIFHMLNLSKTLTTKICTSVAILCIFFNFFASFLFHNFEWNPHFFFFIEKLDHFGIFLMISGSSLPVQALLFNKGKLLLFISLQSMSILFGFLCIFCGCFSSGNRFIRTFTFLSAGFLHSVFIKDYFISLYTSELIFLVSLAVLYVIGAVIYSIKKPNVLPGLIGFHELFHFCCLGSALCTFALNCSVIKRNTQ
ncbi:hemolysin III, putative [Plasmodium gallinaceum]|uniref:Hemolysin III, putative n=1 Tax=Plasmodium gallinaceum TaxID=5849 RepID=A0A1J1GTW2_PLAGA|nr:hemolysin III, putative [Plasmodium gallinaceum]CRG94750.1 hemolysin III, putative [Plasmodium gallinaceum]